MPEVKIQKKAQMIHGLSKKDLIARNGREWTKAASDLVFNFIRLHQDYPIVVYGKKHDYWNVLRPAFESMDNIEKLPKSERVRDALDMASRLPNLYTYFLDDVLEKCGFDRRIEDAYHDAREDAEHCGKVYMHLIKLEDPKKP